MDTGIRRYFKIYIIFNDKIATDQCCYNIRYRYRDVMALSEEFCNQKLSKTSHVYYQYFV
jgi:hypothetical protein